MSFLKCKIIVVLSLFLALFAVNNKAYSQIYVPIEDAIFRQSMDMGLNLGIASYFGQLNYYGAKPAFGGGLYYRYNLSKWISLRGDLKYYNLSNADEYNGRMFKTNVLDLAFRCEVNLLKSFYPQVYSLYAFAGVGGMSSIGKYSRFRQGDKTQTILSTTPYTNFAFDMQLGLGFKYRVVPNFVIGIEAMFHFALPDNVDNQTYKEVNANAGAVVSNNKSDIIPYLGITFGYNLIKYNGVDGGYGKKNAKPSYRGQQYNMRGRR